MTVLNLLDVKGKRSKLIQCCCDQCGKLFSTRFIKTKFENKTKLTFCCQTCVNESKKKGGKISSQLEKKFLKTYGVKNPFQSNEIKEKIKKVCLDRYGVENASSSNEIRKKVKMTYLKNYGVDNPLKSDEIKNKMKKTCVERYGVENVSSSNKINEKRKQTFLKNYGKDHPWKTEEIQQKRRQTIKKHYGVEYPLQSDVIKEKIKQTCIEKYGVENPFQSEEIRKKIKKIWITNYGVDHPLKSDEIKSKIDFKESFKKCHKTMKRNRSYNKSKVEDEFYKFLCEKFGKENIERQIRVQNWIVDFYVKSIETYIQFDGVYWHGLDRPIKVIKESTSSRDKAIFLSYSRDRKQDIWFARKRKRLIRVTDKEFNRDSFSLSSSECQLNNY